MPPSAEPTTASSPSGNRWPFIAIAVVAVLWAVAQSLRLAWASDDAFISFRYADNLVRGHGLIFNVGERVEGYSNFLWTLWCAAGIALGFDPVRWTMGWGIACYAATLGLLAWFTAHRHRGETVGALSLLPLAAMVEAVHRDRAIFATSGLETSMFTLLALVGYLLTLEAPGRPRRAAVAGTVLALVALSRPDGVLFAGVAFVWLALMSPRRSRDLLAFAAPLAVVLAGYAAWKLTYYGDLLPNTYYAKSANRPWFEQGAFYAGLYFRKYWVLGIGGVACAIAAFRSPAEQGPEAATRWRRAAGLAAGFAIVYTLYVMRVGGDFMFARLLIPVTPFLGILLELAVERLVPPRVALRLVVAVLLVAGVAFSKYPFKGQGWVRGIVNEWEFYNPRMQARGRAFGERLNHYFAGLPVHIGICGGQAVLAYYSRVPVAIETATGLTDSTIAHQPLAHRGRIGHEKKTPIPYLIARGTHLWMYSGPALSDTLFHYIPIVPIQLDSLAVMVITWDPPVMAALEARGAKVPDFLGALDQFIARMPAAKDAEVRHVYERLRPFYFARVHDPARETPFRRRLGLPPV